MRFRLGAASAAHQIEMAWSEDGKFKSMHALTHVTVNIGVEKQAIV